MDYELIYTDHKGNKTSFPLVAENIVDIQESLDIADLLQKAVASTGRLVEHLPEAKAGMGRPAECLSDTIEIMSKIPTPEFNY